MSVRKNERGPQKPLTVLTKATDLASHTITVCMSENNFPKKYRWILTNRIVDAAVAIPCCIRQANRLNPKTSSIDYARRRALQDEADGYCDELFTLLETAKKTMPIGSDRIAYWTGLIIEVQGLLENWKASDRRRFGSAGSIDDEVVQIKDEIQLLKAQLCS